MFAMLMTSHMVLKFFAFFYALVVSSTGYKILVFSPTHGRSHMLSHGRLADELALAGHDVTLLEAEYFLKSSELQSAKYAKTISLGGFPKDLLTSAYTDLTASAFKSDQSFIGNHKVFEKWHIGMKVMCEMLLTKHNDTLEDLKEQKFDAIFNYHLNLCGTGLKEVLGIKTHFWFSSCPIMEYMAYILGVPTPTSYIPPLGRLEMSDKPTYGQRFWNMLEYIMGVYVLQQSAHAITNVYRKVFGPNFPDMESLVKDSPITFVVADEILDFPRPILHNTIFVGGLGFRNESKELENSFSSEMEKGRLGVIYLSFGTNTNTNNIPNAFKRNVMQAFKAMPDYHFLVKVDKGDTYMKTLAKQVPNLYVSEWFPQREILIHPRLRIFVTHGGYNSLYESARAGVPIITMPFFWDQYRNGKLAERNGWGLNFEKRELLEGSGKFVNTLNRILDDPHYHRQAQRTKRLLLTKPFSGTDKLVKYTEYVIENGGVLPELQNEGRNLDLIVYFNLDIIIPILVASLIFFYAILKLAIRSLKMIVHFIISSPSIKIKIH